MLGRPDRGLIVCQQRAFDLTLSNKRINMFIRAAMKQSHYIKRKAKQQCIDHVHNLF